MIALAFTPSRGGDGGVYRAPPTPKHWKDNARVVLTDAEPAACVPSPDPADTAHLVRVRVGYDHGPATTINSRLADPAQILARFGDDAERHCRRRRYHPSQVTSRGMPFDSMFDAAAALGARLQADLNIDLGWRTAYPRGTKTPVTADERARVFAGMDRAAVRDMVRPRTRQKRTDQERALEAEASALIRGGRVGGG